MYLEVEAEEQRRETNPWKKVVQSEREIRGKGRRPHRSCHFALRNARGFHRPPSLARISTFQSLCFRKNSLSLRCAQIPQSFTKQTYGQFLNSSWTDEVPGYFNIFFRTFISSLSLQQFFLYIMAIASPCWRILYFLLLEILISLSLSFCTLMQKIKIRLIIHCSIHCSLYCEIFERMENTLIFFFLRIY